MPTSTVLEERHFSRRGIAAALIAFAISLSLTRSLAAKPSDYFSIEVVDDQTGRGVPLVELETVDHVRFVTDSAGLIAFNDPVLLGRKVFFTVTSHGYEFPEDGFKFRAAVLETKAGGHATLKIKRINIAERLYRITGGGVYMDSVLLGRKPPIEQPLMNNGVVGQDSVFAEVYRGKIHWFWGDTSKCEYALGNFSTTGAVSDLPGKGGLDPSVGVNLRYFSDGKGFTKHLVPMDKPGPIWITGTTVIKDDVGQEKLVAHFSRMKDLGTRLERGLIVWNDKTEQFDPIKEVPLDAPLAPSEHPFHATFDGQDYIMYFANYPSVRVKADFKSVTDLSSYEGYTALAEGARYAGIDSKLDRDSNGHVVFSWKKGTPPLTSTQIDELAESKKIDRRDAPFQLVDASTDKPIKYHNGSVYWNDYRKRWVMIAAEVKGTSVLGEIWYAEAKSPLGPWAKAVKIITHNKMDFYNPTQHPFFNQKDGQIIYLEGTYTNSFSGNPYQTPRYEYNQMMYRLDLSDPRLAPARVE